MKYNSTNKPLICMQTQSACYKGTRPMTVRGVLWHSTGANNPSLARYVQPSDGAADSATDGTANGTAAGVANRQQMLQILGTNKYGNDINHTTRQMGVNAWIGKLADGSVATVQAMPWDYKPWGCGNGSRGSCNDGWIQFEICEDGLTDRDYAMAVYREACELTAYLCRMFGIDPRGTVRFNGVTVPTIIDHKGSCALGLGSNHGDIGHWFPKFGKTMDSVRDDVAKLLEEESEEVATEKPADMGEARADMGEARADAGEARADAAEPAGETPLGVRLLRRGMTGDDVAELQRHLIALGYDLGSSGADGDFGPKTEAAVRAFQQRSRLVVDGLYGPKTHAALMEAVKSISTLLVTAETVIRAGNGGQYAVLTTVKSGTRLEYIATAQNGWHAVVSGERVKQVGWISALCSRIE